MSHLHSALMLVLVSRVSRCFCWEAANLSECICVSAEQPTRGTRLRTKRCSPLAACSDAAENVSALRRLQSCVSVRNPCGPAPYLCSANCCCALDSHAGVRGCPQNKTLF